MRELVIEINKDIDRYQESVALGLGGKQLLFSAVSLISGAGIVLLLYRYIGLVGSAYVAIPVVAPIALSGFYSYNGMSFFDVMGRKIHMMFGNKVLTYVSTESEATLKAYQLEDENKNKSKFATKRGEGKKAKGSKDAEPKESGNKEEFETMKKKMKGMIIDGIVIIVLAVAGAAAYKYFK